MVVTDSRINIPRPISDVFAYIADLDHYPEWQPAIKRAEFVDDDVPGEGARIRLLVAGPRGQIQAAAVISEFHPPESLEVRSTSGPAAVRARVDLEQGSDGGATTLALHLEVQPLGLYRFGEGILRTAIQKELPGLLAELSRRVEDAIPATR